MRIVTSIDCQIEVASLGAGRSRFVPLLACELRRKGHFCTIDCIYVRTLCTLPVRAHTYRAREMQIISPNRYWISATPLTNSVHWNDKINTRLVWVLRAACVLLKYAPALPFALLSAASAHAAASIDASSSVFSVGVSVCRAKTQNPFYTPEPAKIYASLQMQTECQFALPAACGCIICAVFTKKAKIYGQEIS